MNDAGSSYGGDDVDVAGDERRRNVGDGEIADSKHFQIVQRVRRDPRKQDKRALDQLAHLHYAAGILLVLDDLESRHAKEVHSPPNSRPLRRATAEETGRGRKRRTADCRPAFA